jgi:transposase
MEQMLTDAQ